MPKLSAAGRFVGCVKILSLAFVAFVGMAVPSYATPTISDLKVTPISPMGLAIDYNVNGVATNDESCPIEILLTVGTTNYVAKNFIGAADCMNGAHRVYWNLAKDGVSVDTKEAKVTVMDCQLYCVIDLSGGSETNFYPVSYMSAKPSDGFSNEVYKTTKLVLRRVDGGSFIIGEDQTHEMHRVTLTKPFYMGIYEVTQKQWELVMGSNPSRFLGDTCPVEKVSYDMIRGSSDGARWPESNAVDASSFLGKLRARTGRDFDLPTEAQWEYTCRAGTTTAFSYGDRENGDYMWYYFSDKEKEVGTKLPNIWGFYDMHGNVDEWCLDWYASSLTGGQDPKGATSEFERRVVRGGSFYDRAQYCYSYYRCYFSSSDSNCQLGFRLSRTLP